ncbi:MAG: aspartate aminotransferase family protein, partial [Nitratireductor sp.]
REFRDTFEAPRQKAVMKSLTRFFASNGVILPNAAAGCLSTPMTEKEIDLVIDIFDEFVREQESEIAAMETN